MPRRSRCCIGRMRNRSGARRDHEPQQDRGEPRHDHDAAARGQIRACSSGGQSNSRKAPSEPSANEAAQPRPNGEPQPDRAQPLLDRVQRHARSAGGGSLWLPASRARSTRSPSARNMATSSRAAHRPCVRDLGRGARQVRGASSGRAVGSGCERGQDVLADRPSPERSCPVIALVRSAAGAFAAGASLLALAEPVRAPSGSSIRARRVAHLLRRGRGLARAAGCCAWAAAGAEQQRQQAEQRHDSRS